MVHVLPTSGLCVQREGGVEKWRKAKQEGFMKLKINTEYLLILKKKILTYYIPECSVGSLYYFPLKS